MHDESHSLVPIDWHPAQKTLRTFGCAMLLLFGGLGYASWHGPLVLDDLTHHPLACALWLCGLSAGVFAWLEPAYNRPLYWLFTCASYPLAWLSAWLLLLGLFFGVITPVSIALRLFRRRDASTSGHSTWRPARAPRDKSSYFRQF
jgi:hypothetical protein